MKLLHSINQYSFIQKQAYVCFNCIAFILSNVLNHVSEELVNQMIMHQITHPRNFGDAFVV